MSASANDPTANDPLYLPPERQVVDRHGTSWSVNEVRVWDASGRQARSLVAANGRGFRRLWHFPANWSELQDEELAELVTQTVQKGAPGMSL